MAQENRGTAALAVLLAACAAPPAGDPWTGAPPQETVGHLGDTPVTYGEIGKYIQLREPDLFARSLTRYLLERVTATEAGPLKITVPPALLTRETARRMEAWRARVRAASRAQTGREIEPALWLQRVAGMSLAEFRALLREGAKVELTQDRLLRYEMLGSPRVEVSMLVVKQQERAAELASRLRKKNSDFPALARKHSLHPSASSGGRIPFPLLGADITQAKVRAALFAAKPGAVLGPFAMREGLFEIYRVEASHRGRKGGYADLERAVALSLEARPVPVGEYERWRRRILLRHGFLAEAARRES